jgi:hypothetical protein
MVLVMEGARNGIELEQDSTPVDSQQHHHQAAVDVIDRVAGNTHRSNLTLQVADRARRHAIAGL